jgi:hypothetical protein
MKAALPYTDCRFCIYDQEYTTADGKLIFIAGFHCKHTKPGPLRNLGRPTSKLWFISWFPNNSTTYHKMAYTSAKTKFRESIPGVFDLQVSSLEELDAALGLGKEEDEDSDIDM